MSYSSQYIPRVNICCPFTMLYTYNNLVIGNSGSDVALINNRFKAGTFDKKQPTNKLKIRILSETSIPYLIRHASFILIVGLHL